MDIGNPFEKELISFLYMRARDRKDPVSFDELKNNLDYLLELMTKDPVHKGFFVKMQ